MKSLYRKIVFFTLFLTSFLLGVVFSSPTKEFIVKNIGKDQLNSIGKYIKIDLVEKQNIVGNKKNDDLNLDSLWMIYSLIKDNYYDIDIIKKEKLIEGISKGLVESLGDKHSEFMTKKEEESFSTMLLGKFEGIGAVVDSLDYGVKIERIFKGSPADIYGLQKDDVIIEVNSINLEGLDLSEAVSHIKGPSGTAVLLKVIRSNEDEILDIEIIRGDIDIPSIEEKYFKKENLGYISLNIFGDKTSDDFREALNNLNNKNIDGLIIDLRQNGGGYMGSAIEILSEFIKKGDLIVTTKYKNAFLNEPNYSTNTGTIFDKKIVIIINENSASASEITAGALREYNKAIIVGVTSYGKGSVQKTLNFPNGTSLKLTIAKWFTPLNKNIDKDGIVPDVEIKFKKEDYDYKECIAIKKCKKDLKKTEFTGYDRQLEEAKTILLHFIEKDTLQIVVDEENERLNQTSKKKNILN